MKNSIVAFLVAAVVALQAVNGMPTPGGGNFGSSSHLMVEEAHHTSSTEEAHFLSKIQNSNANAVAGHLKIEEQRLSHLIEKNRDSNVIAKQEKLIQKLQDIYDSKKY